MSSNKYQFDESLQQQMLKLMKLRELDPEKSRILMKKNEKLVEYSTQGCLRKLQIFTATIDKSDIIYYFVIQAFQASLVKNHLMISDYFIENGFPLNLRFQPILSTIYLLDEISDPQAVSISSFLISKGYDINIQDAKTWCTALHVAVEKQFFDTVRLLVNSSADVNAVGKLDVMPLIIAENLPDSSPNKQDIIQFLKSQ